MPCVIDGVRIPSIGPTLRLRIRGKQMRNTAIRVTGLQILSKAGFDQELDTTLQAVAQGMIVQPSIVRNDTGGDLQADIQTQYRWLEAPLSQVLLNGITTGFSALRRTDDLRQPLVGVLVARSERIRQTAVLRRMDTFPNR